MHKITNTKPNWVQHSEEFWIKQLGEQTFEVVYVVLNEAINKFTVKKSIAKNVTTHQEAFDKTFDLFADGPTFDSTEEVEDYLWKVHAILKQPIVFNFLFSQPSCRIGVSYIANSRTDAIQNFEQDLRETFTESELIKFKLLNHNKQFSYWNSGIQIAEHNTSNPRIHYQVTI